MTRTSWDWPAVLAWPPCSGFYSVYHLVCNTEYTAESGARDMLRNTIRQAPQGPTSRLTMHTLKVTCSHYPLSVKHTIEDITILPRPWRKPVRASLPPPGYHPCSVWYPAFRTLILYIVHFVHFVLWCCFDLWKSGSLEVWKSTDSGLNLCFWLICQVITSLLRRTP